MLHAQKLKWGRCLKLHLLSTQCKAAFLNFSTFLYISVALVIVVAVFVVLSYFYTTALAAALDLRFHMHIFSSILLHTIVAKNRVNFPHLLSL